MRSPKARLLKTYKMKEKKIDNKLRLPQRGLYILVLERINSCKVSEEEIIKFPKVFSKLSSSFSVPKDRVWELLYLLNDLGLIKIHFGHGISLLYSFDLNKNSKLEVKYG